MAEKNTNIVFLSDAADGTSVSVHAGDVLCISLTSTPSAGYRWAIEKMDESVLHQESADYVSPAQARSGSKEMVGGSGHEIFYFSVTGKGSTQLELVYRRPWDKGSAPARTWKVQIAIQG
jgi:predicted secreted protein